ncbi:von Willebrand factor A domain-containing protein 7 [Collichthys lucidus]|uniref:von Willebrand factor A domain-containing protein 7 n=1 Tax=Collichthys lucidus TaxID=240159 RepID=A0A4U5V6A0_COLLU|nr:von Willebrand factor A domain-containing protein 7 [Collichthys lucidus]
MVPDVVDDGNEELNKHVSVFLRLFNRLRGDAANTELVLSPAPQHWSSGAQPFTADAVAVACSAPKSSKNFCQAIIFITLRNIRVDIRHALNVSFHFDEEMFIEGRRIITEGILAVKASNKEENFEAARQKLAEIFHPLQDFYSHSNWVELGSKLPNSNLIRSDTSIGNIADESRATCRNCNGDNCTNNILEDIIEQKILTSGYFGVVPLFSTKPKGKCSHGGAVDQTSTIEPKGGINKDTFEASHGHLHVKAANLAIAATSELLEDIRGAAGDRPFLQMLGISSKALCFVIDTTKSMSDDIEVVKTVTSSIINSEVGTKDEPSLYILVPFDDPNFGPLIRTTDPNVFKNAINALSPSGGGDDAELSLSGLQLALTSAPSNFLFTDAPAKDKHLKSTVIALIERTQSVVGQSPIDFLFDFVKVSQGLFNGFDALVSRPTAGVNGSLLVSLTGSDSATVTEVALVESSGSAEIKGVVEAQGSGNFLVHIDRIPSVEFVVRVKGQNGSVFFQRQSCTNFRSSNLTITADSNSILVPGTPFPVPFSVMTNGIGGNFTIRATNSRCFDSISPTSLFLEAGNSTNGTATLSAPLNTRSGSDVTLTIEAEAPGGEDTNYVVLRFSIVNTSKCSENCSLSTWELSALVTDGAEGTGVDHVSLKQGNGTMNTSLVTVDENITLVSYSASCCSPDMELLVVDRTLATAGAETRDPY